MKYGAQNRQRSNFKDSKISGFFFSKIFSDDLNFFKSVNQYSLHKINCFWGNIFMKNQYLYSSSNSKSIEVNGKKKRLQPT